MAYLLEFGVNKNMLYICATPIGNLKDISLRAIETLSQADVVLCEDTRLSRQLFAFHGINVKKMVALHEHNESQIAADVIRWLDEGKLIVQVSDAGTPGISDPGARLCNKVREHGHQISPLPGACAYISLLSVSGLNKPSLFYGFLPSTTTKRCKVLEQWVKANYAICLYEAPHRILDSLADIAKILGNDCHIIMGRELTKKFETIKSLPVSQLISFIQNDSNQQRGEFVMLVSPIIHKDEFVLNQEHIRLLTLLAQELPPKKAATLAAKILGSETNVLYNYLVNLKH